MSALAGRLFSAWCSITCLLCASLSQHLDNAALVGVTLFSFLVALLFFTLEFMVYRTVDVRGVWMQAVVAGVSTVWLTSHALSMASLSSSAGLLTFLHHAVL